MGHPALKLEGRRFGSLTVIRREKGGWWVRCDCGREYRVAARGGIRERCVNCRLGDEVLGAKRRAWAYSGLYRLEGT